MNKQYFEYVDKCLNRIQWISCEDTCAIMVVRNAMLENSAVCPPDEMRLHLAGSTQSVPMAMGALGLIATTAVAGLELSNRRKVPLLENEAIVC